MKALFEELSDVLAGGEEAVLVTIIASSGSTPRGTGSRTPVKKDNIIKGIAGSGAVGYQTILTAAKVIKHRPSHAKGFTLTRNQVVDIDMVCRGNVVVYFQYISPDNKEFVDFCTDMRMALSGDEDSWLLLDITDETCQQMGLYSKNIDLLSINMPGRFTDSDLFRYSTSQRKAEGHRYHVEPLVQAGAVYVFGGGHVVQELVPILIHIGFRYVVVDDREEFVSPQVFPTTVDTIVGDLERTGDYIKIRPCDYICVMTRGHQFDYYIQKQAITFKPCYTGTMGGRSKIRMVTDKLLGDGFSRGGIEGCHMPIGAEIHAETPAEIAIGIAGKLIDVRTAGMGLKSKIDGQKQRKSRAGNLAVR